MYIVKGRQGNDIVESLGFYFEHEAKHCAIDWSYDNDTTDIEIYDDYLCIGRIENNIFIRG